MSTWSIYNTNSLFATEEKLSRYQPGGFHPVALGDTFNDRYTVVHKLGFGGFSTVWVAEDALLHQWVALKVMTSQISETSRELNWFHTVSNMSGDLASEYIVKLLDVFFVQGPNGRHKCLVFELLGPTLRTIMPEEYKDRSDLDPQVILRMSEHLLRAVIFVHEAKFAHGDISTKNMAFTADHLRNMTKENLFEVMGVPFSEELSRIDGNPIVDGIPKYLVRSTTWDGWANDDKDKFRLLDFGESYIHGEEPEVITQPGALMGPETVLTEVFDYKLDLWRLGLALYSFVFGGLPFYCIGDRDSLVMQMIEFVGEEVPDEWKLSFDNLRIDYKRQPLFEGDLRTDRGLEYQFREKIQEEELQSFLGVIQGLMRFRPSERISALQALKMLQSPPAN